MFLKTIFPSKALIPYIDRYTVSSNIDEMGTVLCDKFIPTIGEAMVFHFRDRSVAIIDQTSTVLPNVIFVGHQTKYIYIDPGQVFDNIIVKFKPLFFFRFFNASFNEITNRYLDAGLILGREIVLLHEQLGEITNVEQRIALLEDYFIKHLSKLNNAPKYIDALQSAVNAIIKNSGRLKLSEINQLICMGERTFRRNFNLQVGISAKSFSRLVKFGHVMQEMLQYPACKEIDLTYKYNYFDQTHFINDFKDIMGETPQSFLKRDTSHGKLLSAMLAETKE